MRWIILTVIAAVAAFMIYVRLSPTPVARVHQAAAARDPGNVQTAGGFTAVRTLSVAPEAALARVQQIATATPRTRLFAGTVAEGLMTFETRSRVFGFPDHTTVAIIPAGAAPGGNTVPLIALHGRLRFGKSDMGVNKARILDWLAQMHDVIAHP